MKQSDFMSICRNSAKRTLAPDEESFLGTIGEAIEKAFELDMVSRGKAINEAIEKQVGTFEGSETVASVIRTMSKKVDEVEAKSKRSFSQSEKYQLKRMLEDKKEDILSVARKQSQQPWGLEFKAKRAASALMTTATVLTGATAINNDNVFDDMELIVIRYPKNFIVDAINGRQVAKVPQTMRWKEQIVAGDGVPTKVLEGGIKPLVDKKFIWKFAEREKYAAHIEITEELEIDFDQLLIQIIDMFEQDVLRVYNAAILAAIIAWAPVYAGTALDGTILQPTLMNVINAGRLDIALDEYMADTLILNPSDYAETQNMQNSLGDPIFIPDSVLFPALNVIVSNNMPVGTALIGESGLIKEQHGSFILRSGLTGDQFITNERTIVGEIFSILKLPTESQKGWVKLDIDTVKDALRKPTGN